MQIYSFILGITIFTIPHICCISKNHLEGIRHDEFCYEENIITENNSSVFRSWLNPTISTKGYHWSSMIKENPYLHRSSINFCSAPDDSGADIRVGGGLYANSDYYQPQYPKEDGLGIFKYYNFSQIKHLHADRLDLTPDFVNGNSSISQNNTKLFFTNLLNNLLNDWYWKTFKRELSNSHIPDFYNQWSLVNQDWDFWAKNCNDLMQLEFGVEYNEIQKTHVPIDKWESIFIGALASAVFSFIPASRVVGALTSFISSAIISYAMPKIFDLVSFKNVHQVHRFISKPLTMTFWSHLFTNLFGIPGNPKGVLFNFINKYQELPSQLHLDNFDFYLPLTNFRVDEHSLDFHNASLEIALHTTAMRAGVDLLELKDKLVNSDPGWWGWWVPLFLDMNTAKYADGDRYLVNHMLQHSLSHFHIPEELFKYFSLSHTKLIYHYPTPATLYFNKNNKHPELGISFEKSICVQGTRWRNL